MKRNDWRYYDRHASEWWQSDGRSFGSLHELSRLRLALLGEWIADGVAGASLLDIGCGGGLMAEPLARLGARVVGLDISLGSLREARRHCASWPNRERPAYVRADLRRLPVADDAFDGVLLADVLEHIPQPEQALQEAVRTLAPGGWLFVNTVNRTLLARLLVVYGAELVGLIPWGTHDPKLLVDARWLVETCRALGLELLSMTGEGSDIWRSVVRRRIAFRRTRSVQLAYSVLFRKVSPCA